MCDPRFPRFKISNLNSFESRRDSERRDFVAAFAGGEGRLRVGGGVGCEVCEPLSSTRFLPLFMSSYRYNIVI